MFASGAYSGEAIGEWQGDPFRNPGPDLGEYAELPVEHDFVVIVRRLRDPECAEETVRLARRDDA